MITNPHRVCFFLFFLIFYHKLFPSNTTLKNTCTHSNELKKEKQKCHSAALCTSTSLPASLCRCQFHNEYGVRHSHACPHTFFYTGLCKCKYPECFLITIETLCLSTFDNLLFSLNVYVFKCTPTDLCSSGSLILAVLQASV